MQQVRKRGIQGAEAVYLNVGDHCVHLYAQLSAFP